MRLRALSAVWMRWTDAAVLTALFLLAAPFAMTQDPGPARVGLVSLHAPELASDVDGIRQELRKLGYVDGKAVEIEAHFTNGDIERPREVVKSFVERRVDISVPWTTPTAQPAKEINPTIAIVMIASDPVAAKLMPSLARLGDNITGVSMFGPDLSPPKSYRADAVIE